MRPFFYDLSVEGNCLKVMIFGEMEIAEAKTLSRAIETKLELLSDQIKHISFDLTNVDNISEHFSKFLLQLKGTVGNQKIIVIKHANNLIRKALTVTGLEKDMLGIDHQPANFIKQPSLSKFVDTHFDSLVAKQIALVAYANRGQSMAAKNLAALMNKSLPRIAPHLKSLTESGLLVTRQEGKKRFYHFTDDRRLVADFMQLLTALNDPYLRRLIRMQIHLNWQKKKQRQGIMVTEAKVIDLLPRFIKNKTGNRT